MSKESQIINSLIKDEKEAIAGYNKAIHHFRKIGRHLTANSLSYIRGEEINHLNKLRYIKLIRK